MGIALTPVLRTEGWRRDTQSAPKSTLAAYEVYPNCWVDWKYRDYYKSEMQVNTYGRNAWTDSGYCRDCRG